MHSKKKQSASNLVGRPILWLERAKRYIDLMDGRDDGLFSPGGHWRVIYSDGKRSRVMRHGNAVGYAQIFGGIVVHI